ncbi:MAG: PIN domain-containing protein [Spirochaetales bacterium]|nr:PIN domain-containing protein [Spirochaetales bacterium]
MRILIDTNVAVDIMARREPFIGESSKVLLLCASGLTAGFFSASAFTDLHYILRRHLHNEKDVRSALRFWLTIIDIIDSDSGDCTAALDSEVDDYEDAVICEAARRRGLDYIVTRNPSDFVRSPVPAITPGEFLKLALKY